MHLRGVRHPVGEIERLLTSGLRTASDESAVIWTKPDDFVPDPDNPIKGLVGLRPGGFLAGFADGSVRFFSASIDGRILQALFTRNGGEVVNPPELGRPR
ncbi:MAG: DUF1559 domain-containing protein [Planctomycetota bacterium]